MIMMMSRRNYLGSITWQPELCNITDVEQVGPFYGRLISIPQNSSSATDLQLSCQHQWNITEESYLKHGPIPPKGIKIVF